MTLRWALTLITARLLSEGLCRIQLLSSMAQLQARRTLMVKTAIGSRLREWSADRVSRLILDTLSASPHILKPPTRLATKAESTSSVVEEPMTSVTFVETVQGVIMTARAVLTYWLCSTRLRQLRCEVKPACPHSMHEEGDT